jgi:hypothetical protein
MNQRNYTRYFRVFKNDTVVTEVSTNDFQPLKLTPVRKDWLIGPTAEVFCAISAVNYALPAIGLLYYGYTTRAKAMEMAKAEALEYIDSLINQGEPGNQTLLQYRMDHYEDLNINLVEENIYKVENELPGALDQHLL